MSVKAMSWVWEHSRAKGSARLVLLALADHAGHDGGDAYPSVRRLAERCGVSERTVQDALKTLAELGELVVNPQAGPRGVNRYQLTLTPAESAPPQNLHPRSLEQEQVQISHPTPAESAPEPSLNLPMNPSSSCLVPEAVWLLVAKTKARNPKVPVNDFRAWSPTVIERDKAEHGTDAAWIWTTYDITESQLANIIATGSRTILTTLRKRDTAA